MAGLQSSQHLESETRPRREPPVRRFSLKRSCSNMPGGEDGFVLARWVRQHRPDTKILVTSGDAATAAGRAGGMRVDGPLLVKPYQYEIVLKRIESLLGEAKEIGSGSGA
jgi:DNA-binding response OmpR family regulator